MFAARVEGSLVDVVTPDELTMQKCWPAHDAVAKLRHEAAISECTVDFRQAREDEVVVRRVAYAPNPPISRGAARARMGPARDDGESGSGLPRLYDCLRQGLGLFKAPFRSSRLRLGLSLTWDILHRQ